MRKINVTQASDQRPQLPSRLPTNDGIASPCRAASVEQRSFVVAKDSRSQGSPFTPGSASRRLWPSSNGTFSSLQAISAASLLDSCSEAKRQVTFGNPSLRPAANGVQRSVDLTGQRKTPQRRGTTPERKGTPTRRRLTADQAENARPTEAVQSRVNGQETPTRRRINLCQLEISQSREAIQLKSNGKTPQRSQGERKAGFLCRSMDLGIPQGGIPSRNVAALLTQASLQSTVHLAVLDLHIQQDVPLPPQSVNLFQEGRRLIQEEFKEMLL